VIVSNEFDGGICDALAEKLVVLAHKDESLTHREIIMAHIGAICSTMTAISCKGCREVTAKLIESALPDLVRCALEEAAEHYSGQPPTSDHTH
jgi:hypothetical protein